jgi:membrane protein YdbS with pleckstrin-like domain
MRKKEFRPNPAMKIFLYTSSLLILAASVLSWSIPVAVSTHDPLAKTIILWVHVVTAFVAIWLIIWVPKYYESITYAIDDKWLYAEGGVFWKRRSRLPISRVQMVDVNQGPWQRVYGLASLRVFTAATGQSTAELSFQNIENADRLRDHVLELVQKYRAGDNGLGESLAATEGAPAPTARAGIRGASDEAQVARLLDSLLNEVREIRRKLKD